MGFFSSLFSRSSQDSSLPRSAQKTLHKGSEDDVVLLARRLVDQNQLEQALAVLKTAAQRFPSSDVIDQLTESVEESFHRASIGGLHAQLESDGSPEIRAKLAELYRRVGDIPMAMKYGREAIDADNTSPVGYRKVGRLYLEQFRLGLASVQGINALRYLSKAHNLDPRDSRILLYLAEIFIILRAPQAAGRFFGPVQRAFPNDPHVIRLEERIRELPNEETSNIQDLFLRHEQRQSGEHMQPAESFEAPVELGDQFREFGESLEGVSGLFLLDGERKMVCEFSPSGWSSDELEDSLGVLADTSRQNSQRMGIGTFNRLMVRSADHMLVTQSLGSELSFFFIGDKNTKLDEVDSIMERAAALVGCEKVEASQ